MTIPKYALIALLVTSTACGTLFNKKTVTYSLPPGVTIDGQAGLVTIDQQSDHLVMYPDGRTCVISPSIEAVWVILDIFMTGLVGIVVDAITGDWKGADAGGCPAFTTGPVYQ